MNTLMGSVLVVLGVVVGLALLLLLGYWPGLVAKRRGHPSATAIRILGLVGLLIWPCWLIALIWAYTGKAEPTGNEPDYHLSTRHPLSDVEARVFEVKSRRRTREMRKGGAAPR
jgi:hypothetical protein